MQPNPTPAPPRIGVTQADARKAARDAALAYWGGAR